jgi:PAS domain S-box-containing protein
VSLNKILVVEDEVIISMEIQERVKALGYEVVGTADTMDKAIEQARTKKPDLCLMDIMLKGTGTGIDAAKVIYDELNIPIIFMTAYSDDATLEKAKVVSPYGYILKPLDKNAMRIAIEIALYKHSMELKLIVSERKFSELFKQTNLAVFISDSKGKIKDANPALYKMLKVDDIDSINGNAIYSYFENKEVGFNDLINAAKNKNEVAKSVVNITTSSGELRYANAIINLVSDKTGNIILVEGFLDDITERVAHEKFLVKAKEDAEKMESMKDDFLAGMSHEIRTPVNTILSYISLLSEEFDANMNAELELILSSINNGGKRLIRTIDMILNTADLNAGSFEPLKSELDILSNVMNPLFNEFKEQARKKNLEFNIINNATNVIISSDLYSVSQIFSNLIDNSLKYTNTGKIDIILENPSDNLLSVKVVDTGKGIAEDFLPTLFSAFTQEESGYKRRFDGTGLGMSLVKRYCELIGAEIKVKSKKNEGTTFDVIFKLN